MWEWVKGRGKEGDKKAKPASWSGPSRCIRVSQWGLLAFGWTNSSLDRAVPFHYGTLNAAPSLENSFQISPCSQVQMPYPAKTHCHLYSFLEQAEPAWPFTTTTCSLKCSLHARCAPHLWQPLNPCLTTHTTDNASWLALLTGPNEAAKSKKPSTPTWQHIPFYLWIVEWITQERKCRKILFKEYNS